MLKFAFALLTTLFVYVTPLYAATAEDIAPTSAGCLTIETIVSPTEAAKVETDGGSITKLEGAQAQAFLFRLEDLIGSKAPFTVDAFLLVKPDVDSDSYNIAIFGDGCMKTVMHLPTAVVEGSLLSSPTDKSTRGEKVD